MDPNDERDYAEEAYWRDYCPECDGKCVSENGHADLTGEPTEYDRLLSREAERWAVETGRQRESDG